MSIYIFTGPTIDATEAQQWLDANYLPPVSQGDVLSLLRLKPKAIGIIDGYFDSVPAVWHKEILFAIKQGVHVVGAASMGALRAAELHSFGMVGIGRVFEWYRDGVIDADDAVALHHAPAEFNFKPLSEPLVNIRATLLAAMEAAVLSNETCETLMTIAERTIYWERAYQRLLSDAADAGVAPGELATLRDFVAAHAIDLKRQDAVALLKHLAAGQFRAAEPAFAFQDTVFFSGLSARDRTIAERNGAAVTLDELITYARVDPKFVTLRKQALHSQIALDLARQQGLVATPAARDRVRQRLGFVDAAAVASWLHRNGVGDDELNRWIDELATIETVESAYLSKIGNGVLRRQLIQDDVHEQLLEDVLQQKRSKTHAPSEGVPGGVLLERYFADIGRKVPEDVHAHAAMLGFTSYAHFLLALEKRYGTNLPENKL